VFPLRKREGFEPSELMRVAVATCASRDLVPYGIAKNEWQRNKFHCQSPPSTEVPVASKAPPRLVKYGSSFVTYVSSGEVARGGPNIREYFNVN